MTKSKALNCMQLGAFVLLIIKKKGDACGKATEAGNTRRDFC